MIYTGIGGWTFAPWRGTFYPPGLRHADELAFAASQLTAIEINGTFYGRQKPESFARWRDETPDGFVFSVKASRFTTHRKDLAEAGELVRSFVASGITELGPKLGPILWQFPSTRQFDPDQFASFLSFLPLTEAGIPLRHAVETRHPSFAHPAYMELLRDRGIAHAVVDSPKHPLLLEQTAAFTYARLERNDAAAPEGYESAALDRWAGQVRAWCEPASRDAFVFFISGDKVQAPVAAQRFRARLTES